ncbi:hypothetical protein [Timonella sp. A28]|uniref:hypothetical protein n=1 Tax=Timonella sp. A28 TaxID=3442640 RepID=UPI003EB9F6C4
MYTATSAEGTGWKLTFPQSETTVDGKPVFVEGTNIEFALQFYKEAISNNATQTITFGPEVVLPETVPNDFPDLIASIVTDRGAGTITITFRGDINDSAIDSFTEGVIKVAIRNTSTETSGFESVDIRIGDGTPQTFDFFVQEQSDEPFTATQNTQTKTANTNLTQHVSVDGTTGKVTVNPAISDEKIRYTLDTTALEERTSTVTDTLDAALRYNEDFTITTTTWDANGYNKTVGPQQALPVTLNAEKDSFTADLTLPARSQTTITYTASLRAEQAALVEAELQRQYDEALTDDDKVDNGFNLVIPAMNNTATWSDALTGGTPTEYSRTVGGNVWVNGLPKPNTGTIFTKSSAQAPKIIDPQRTQVHKQSRTPSTRNSPRSTVKTNFGCSIRTSSSRTLFQQA